ncbi:MAG: GGDEF domain-containing protein [Gammaproteobacteria bacterium]
MWTTLSLTFLAADPGILPSNWTLPLATAVLATNLFFFLMLRLGISEGRADPSMAKEQIIVAMTWLLVPIIAQTGLRDLFLIGYVMIMMFGLLALRGKALSMIASYAFVSYAAIVMIDAQFFPLRFDAGAEFRRLLMLGGMLGWCAFFGNYVSALRHKLNDQNKELTAALKDISKLTSEDDLTQAFNRRYIMDALHKEKARCDRSKDPFSVVLMDIDHFKGINDRYGHLAGDRVLIGLCERMRGALRGMDVLDSLQRSELARYGGEEFIVLLPQTELEGALRCADRLCSVTRERPFEDVFDVTMSAGVATYAPGESVESLLQRADQGLYKAKDEGRDRVVSLEVPPFDPIAVHPFEASPVAADDTALPSNVVVGQFGQGVSKDSV